ncbi:MAG: hypothetical protein HC866_19560, partial [Leptolyngbyaceae cyanobacterium RU_5_1]|nr:hypothetical protein [Leptolyngbyaceae cyanobacterium RU_5_1]
FVFAIAQDLSFVDAIALSDLEVFGMERVTRRGISRGCPSSPVGVDRMIGVGLVSGGWVIEFPVEQPIRSINSNTLFCIGTG